MDGGDSGCLIEAKFLVQGSLLSIVNLNRNNELMRNHYHLQAIGTNPITLGPVKSSKI